MTFKDQTPEQLAEAIRNYEASREADQTPDLEMMSEEQIEKDAPEHIEDDYGQSVPNR